ncbi:uncharacterized protein N7511_001281 [Penicillium nucicola]|uniref:uncharacterized protein n=1 Tax=Penicillium nucicola TaxID=1850975 RepID=UPI002545A05B|nr:uncharacterized protein N7511_001281 [Penicillium nucicola]KAJ5776270.1 hypothetical protein N7511_001281 [Penicillium nucicola]
MGQKRGHDSKAQALQTKKRKKSTKADVSDEGANAFVGVEDLNWKEVALPDRMEDAEGFFGLEEIDGVDIIKGENGGEVQFKAKSGKPRKSILKAPEEGDEDEWAGFSDDDSTDKAAKKTPTADATDVKEDKKPKKEKKKNEKKNDKKTETTAKEENESKKPEQKPKQQKPKKDQSMKSALSFEALEEDEDEDSVDVSAWDVLNLSPEIYTSLSKMKFSSPSAIQKASIPAIMDGHDVVGKASTGSGKTLAFAIPIIEHYLDTRGKQDKKTEKSDSTPIALILSPTRELAHQLAKHIGELTANAPDTNARIALLTGGLSIQKQQRQLAAADIVVGTPGRVWEILSQGQGIIRRMQKIKFLVVDEADRLLSEGHFKEVEDILGALDKHQAGDIKDTDEEAQEEEEEELSVRQTLVFSATFHRDLQQKLAGKSRWTNGDMLDNKESMDYLLKKLNFREEKPKFIDVNPVDQMAQGLKEGIVECPAMEKDLYVYSVLLYYPKHRTIIFTNSISAVRRVTQLLQALQLPAFALHSSMAQKARLRSIERFSSPTADPSSILVATDVAARGLDIKGIDMVIHYHVPRAADMYVHRSGRTARAGASGKSILICAPEEVVGVARLAAKINAKKNKGEGASKKLPLESLDIDRRVVARLRPRINLAKRITDTTIAKEKVNTEDNWLRAAAEDLGVEYDSDEFDQSKGQGRGRGGGRQRREKEASGMTKGEMAGLRAELKQLLSERVNIGVSEKYLTSGRIDVEALLRGEGNKAFLGHLDPLSF